MLPMTGAIDMARTRVAQGFRRIISGDPEGTPEWVRQLADGVDSGYFGPGSAAWTVHGSLPTLVGGVRALLMQALWEATMKSDISARGSTVHGCSYQMSAGGKSMPGKSA